jgi:hypothetical protein
VYNIIHIEERNLKIIMQSISKQIYISL